MKTALLFLLTLVSIYTLDAADLRERMGWNDGWKFQKEDPADLPADQKPLYDKIKAWILPCRTPFISALPSKASPHLEPFPLKVSYADPDFDDSAWRKITLPHDWAIEGPFDLLSPGNTGKLPFAGVGWYRKTFEIPMTDSGKEILLDIDGAMSYSSVWCNGQFVGGWPYGYTSYRLNLTSSIKFGGKNTVAIRLENPPESSRWYPGAGIYRHVWLTKVNPVHVAQWGTFITTSRVSPQEAMVEIAVQLENRTKEEVNVELKTEIFHADSPPTAPALAAFPPMTLPIPARSQGETSGSIFLPSPRLWSPDSPSLYRAVTTVFAKGKKIDSYETTFGIRTLEFSSKNGFLLNGKRVQLNGVCNHHDLGALGAAFNRRAAERQLEILKEMGCNALRTSHNPPAPELLDLCDRMGILVMAESFDCWKKGKLKNDYSLLWKDWHEADLRALIRRDRNHPSVILWSVGNEIPDAKNVQMTQSLRQIVESEDPTRPATQGYNNPDTGFKDIPEAIGIFGYNYKPHLYQSFIEKNPTIPLIGSETASTISSRGEYFFLKQEGGEKFQVSSYDLDKPGWGTLPDLEFKFQDLNPRVLGEFVWTGFDYLGEPTPYNQDKTNLLNFTNAEERAKVLAELEKMKVDLIPSRSSYFGIVDLCGFKKDRFYLYQSRWKPELPMAHLMPHWNWPDRVGKEVPVQVYTSGDEAELFLNGISLGCRSKKEALNLGDSALAKSAAGATDQTKNANLPEKSKSEQDLSTAGKMNQSYRLSWEGVIYEQGELKVVVYKEGQPWAEDRITTTGPVSKLKLSSDRARLRADGEDLSFVTVSLTDQKGSVVPQSKNRVAFEISGPGEIVAMDNGDPTDLETFSNHHRRAFNGLALVIVRSLPGKKGEITLTGRSEGLEGAKTVITVE